MSHLARIVEAKSAMIELGVNDPMVQQQVIERQFAKAIIGYAFTNNGVTPLGIAERLNEKVCNQLSLWNEVSPINGNLIREMAKQFLIEHFRLGMTGGAFKPFPCALPEGTEQSEALHTALFALFNKLVEELCTGEE